VLAETDMSLAVLDAGHFRRWLTQRPEVRTEMAAYIHERDELYSLPLFVGVRPPDLDALLAGLESARYDAGDAIVKEGEPGEAMYIIAEGHAKVTQAGRYVRELKRGDYFGEVSLLYGSPRTATVTAVAVSPVRTYMLSKRSFDRLLALGGRESVEAGIARYPDRAR
jgi:cAMP-dependent protein kinase regulator